MNTDETIRLRKVEDAIISFDNIAKIVIVDLKERVKSLEAKDEILASELHQNSDSKTKEIDNKVMLSETDVYAEILRSKTTLVKMIIGVIAIQGSLFMLFVGAVMYFNATDVYLREKINGAENSETENSTNIKSISKDLGSISRKLDSLF